LPSSLRLSAGISWIVAIGIASIAIAVHFGTEVSTRDQVD
jgi:hypothetical protein